MSIPAVASTTPTSIRISPEIQAKVDLFVSILAPAICPQSDVFEERITQAFSLIGYQPRTTLEELAQFSKLNDLAYEARMRRWQQGIAA